MKIRSHVLSPSVARGIAALCAAVFVASAPSIARAAGVVGKGTAASCTEAALNAALVGGGLVTFKCGPKPVTITLTHQKDISSDTTVDGSGLVTLDGNHAVRAFSVAQGRALSVENLTILNGYGPSTSFGGSGGAIYNGGTLTVTNSTFSGNRSFSPLSPSPFVASGGSGGAIYNGGTLTVTNSTFSGNGGASCGPGCSFLNGGAIYNGGTLTVINSTFSGNNAGAFIGYVFWAATTCGINTQAKAAPSRTAAR